MDSPYVITPKQVHRHVDLCQIGMGIDDWTNKSIRRIPAPKCEESVITFQLADTLATDQVPCKS